MSFDIAVTLQRGEFREAFSVRSSNRVTALVGASGSGKTSLLLAVAGLVRPLNGHIRVGGRTLFDAAAGIDVPARNRDLGVVFQDARLFPHLRVRDNLAYARRADAAAVSAMAARLGLESLLDRWPRHLSGGEARRVALGRALLAAPSALLLDEPLAHVDPARASEMLRLLREVSRDLPVLYITHVVSEAEQIDATIVTAAQKNRASSTE